MVYVLHKYYNRVPHSICKLDTAVNNSLRQIVAGGSFSINVEWLKVSDHGCMKRKKKKKEKRNGP